MARQSRVRPSTLPRAKQGAPPAREVVERLARVFPGATTELAYRTPFELLVATILSAQSTDARVNQVTPALFAVFPDARALAAADPAELERRIKPTGFFRAKTRALIGAAGALVERHGGEVPARMEDLVQLPGVGRKTANVVLGHAMGVPGLPVDRHVFRVANRIGIARAKTPEEVEQQLIAALPPAHWTLASDVLILHGRRICRPRPLCTRCVLTDVCIFYRAGGVTGAQTAGVAHRPSAKRDTSVSREGRKPTPTGRARAQIPRGPVGPGRGSGSVRRRKP